MCVCEVACLPKESQKLAHILKSWAFGMLRHFWKLFFSVSRDFLAVFAFTQVEQEKKPQFTAAA